MLRPRPARWFEVLAAREDATLVLEALARTGAVELESRPGTVSPAEYDDVVPWLAQVHDLAARYRAYWPDREHCRPSAWPETPIATLQRCLATMRGWAQDAEPVILALQRGEAEVVELHLWQPVLHAIGDRQLDASRLVAAGPLVNVRLVVLPVGADLPQALGAAAPGLEMLVSPFEVGGVPHALVAAAPATLDVLAQRIGALKGRLHAVPRWLQIDADASEAFARQRLQTLADECASSRASLEALHAKHELQRAIGDANRLQWVWDNVRALEAGPLLCWITGWSSDAAGERVADALAQCAGRALLHYPLPPAGLRPPVLLTNPPWARAFEIFSRALGMPSANDADPTPLLAIVVPLMFGYMFGDVGQGLVIAAVGWWYRGRFAIARLLMIGGLSASVFGLLFGSLFSLHGVLPALWLHPLDAPLRVLIVPLFGGAALLTAGLALDTLAAWWRGEIRHWLLTDAALIVVYLGLLAGFFEPAGWAVAAAGGLWFAVGHAVHARRGSAALGAVGELLEKTLQILINTLSFARVGAFALAHAGLSSAIVALVDAADHALTKAAVLLVGNALVIVLETMVVSIQTTRLVLFEFFTRFMQGQGRVFRPLPAPPFTTQEN